MSDDERRPEVDAGTALLLPRGGKLERVGQVVTDGGPDLRYAIGLAPEAMLAYLRERGHVVETWRWHEMWQRDHELAFTVAKAAKLDVLEDLREAVGAIFQEGLSEREFDRRIRPILQAKGWWGRQERVNPATGETELVQLGSGWRIRTIYRTNVATAYASSRHAAMIANRIARPYWQYNAILDQKTRPEHRRLHGLVFRWNDPFWRYFFPPNDWNCRCLVVALSAAQVARRGLVVSRTQPGDLAPLEQVVGGVSRETMSYRGIAAPAPEWAHVPSVDRALSWLRGRIGEAAADLGITDP